MIWYEQKTCEVKQKCLHKVTRSFIIDVILAWKVQMAKPASMLYLKPPILFKAVNQFTNSSRNSSPTHWLSECFECFFNVPWVVSFLILFVLKSKLILHRLCDSSDAIPHKKHPGTQLRRNLRRNFEALKTDPIARPSAWSAHPFAKQLWNRKEKNNPSILFIFVISLHNLRISTELMLLLFVAAFHAEFLLFAVQIRTTCLGLINIWPSLVRHVKSHAEELVVAGHASKE